MGEATPKQSSDNFEQVPSREEKVQGRTLRQRAQGTQRWRAVKPELVEWHRAPCYRRVTVSEER